jgi:TPR repeat protein
MGMNRTFKAAVAALILAVSFAGSVAAGPFEDATVAYGKGDYATALRLIRPLAEGQGNVLAEFNLGLMYENGQGVPQDYAAAMSWYRKAAEQGSARAQVNLGVMYGTGEGVPQDYVIAHMWLNLAAVNGDKDAVKGRDMVAAQMTPAQIAEAQKLARGWKPIPAPH